MNDYEYVYLLVESSANYGHTDICPASVLGGSRASHEEIWSLLYSNMESAYLTNIKTSYACTYSNTRPRHVEANIQLHFPFWINRLSGLCKQKKNTSHSCNRVHTGWHYRKMMMCHLVGSFISMFYNRRRVEVIKLCHHYNEPGPPFIGHPMRHERPA